MWGKGCAICACWGVPCISARYMYYCHTEDIQQDLTCFQCSRHPLWIFLEQSPSPKLIEEQNWDTSALLIAPHEAPNAIQQQYFTKYFKITLKQKRFKDIWEKFFWVQKQNAGLLPFHIFVCFQSFTAIRKSLLPWGFCWLLAGWHFPWAAGTDSDKWEHWHSAAGYLLPFFSGFLRNRVWSMKIKQEEMILQSIF